MLGETDYYCASCLRRCLQGIQSSELTDLPERSLSSHIRTEELRSRRYLNIREQVCFQGLYNTDKSISAFARSCFNYALDVRQDLWFATKILSSKTYDHRFKDIFAQIYEEEYKAKFEDCKIGYFYTLIDDAVARVMRPEGGFVWACKNYDGDVMSDMLASANGSLAMMTSVLASP